MARCKFYVTVAPEWGRARPGQDDRSLDGIRAVNMTQNRPRRGDPRGSVVVALTIDVPDAAFYPLRPEAVVVVPESLTDVRPVEVEAVEPEREPTP